jgi:hypothetical protein
LVTALAVDSSVGAFARRAAPVPMTRQRSDRQLAFELRRRQAEERALVVEHVGALPAKPHLTIETRHGRDHADPRSWCATEKSPSHRAPVRAARLASARVGAITPFASARITSSVTEAQSTDRAALALTKLTASRRNSGGYGR